MDGNKETIYEQEKFLKEAQEAVGVKRLVLKNETKNFDYWPTSSRILDLSKLDACETLIVQDSFFQIIPPPNLQVFEYTGCCNGDLPTTVLSKLKCLAVTVDGRLPRVGFLSVHYPILEVLEIHTGEEDLSFDDLVEDVKALDITGMKQLQKISVVFGKKMFSREVSVEQAQLQEVPKKILAEWLQRDLKLAQVLKKITSFKKYVDDHDKGIAKIDEVLIIQKQKLVDGTWTSRLRKHDESNGTHDNSWCCPFPTRNKNCLYIQADDGLHLSTWSTGADIYAPEQRILEKTRWLIQQGETDREYNLLFTREQLLACLQKETEEKKLSVKLPVYNSRIYERAMREWRRFQDPRIDCETHEECVQQMFEFYNDEDVPTNHWFLLCPELQFLDEYTVESEARKALTQILKELKIELKKHADLGNRLTFVGWYSNEEEEKQWLQTQESMQAQGPDIKLHLLGPGDVLDGAGFSERTLWQLWHLYYNTRFNATMPARLGMATFKMYHEADLSGLFPTDQQSILYKSFGQYRYDAAIYLLPTGKVAASKFQVDKDQDLWAEHWFWQILKDTNACLRDALLDTKDAKLWFDGYRCIGLENVRRKLTLSLMTK